VRQDLKRLSVRGGVAAVSGHAGKVVLTVASTMVLARLLRPHDFGLVAMVTAVTGFSTMFRDFGLSAATIQREDVRHDHVSTLFWVNLGISAFLAAAIAGLAPAIAWFYGEPLLVGITLALASASLFDGLGIQHNAIFRRQMRFGALAVIELASVATGTVIAVSCAWLGAGYWSLVALQLVMVGTRTVLLWWVSDWRPGTAGSLSEVRPMLAFGTHLTASRMVNFATRSLDKILVGKIWSARLLGFYSKASNGMVLPFQQGGHALSRVAVPTLSRLQNDPPRYRSYFMTALLLVATVGLPAVAFLAVDAEVLVRVVLGGQWIDTVPFVRILAPVAVLEMVNMTTRWVFVSLGQGSRLLRWRLFESLLKVVGLAIGIRWGPVGLAAGLAVVSTALIVPGVVYCCRRSSLTVADFATPSWRPLLAAAAGGAGVLCLRALGVEGWNPLATLALDAPVFVAASVGMWLILPRGRATLMELLRLANELRPSD
jgi:O-antigen/teichoic acid export membrane protein